MGDTPLTLRLSDADATMRLGAALARALPTAREAAAVLYLRGDLGAGKTTCARSVLYELGVTGIVRSPTYTLVEIHAAREFECVHVDLYRLRGASDLEDLGLRDYLGSGRLLLIEWPERGEPVLPPADLDLSFAYLDSDADTGREARLRAESDCGRAWLCKLRQALEPTKRP